MLKVLISIRSFSEVVQDHRRADPFSAPQNATDLIPNLFIMGTVLQGTLCLMRGVRTSV